ncbi:MAG: DUF5522 domain-containing protein [Terracidiphilus sp.]
MVRFYRGALDGPRPIDALEENTSMDGSHFTGVSRPPGLDPEDYYFEGPLMVFTAAYHLKRGTCCGSGCRHCPWRESVALDESAQKLE